MIQFSATDPLSKKLAGQKTNIKGLTLSYIPKHENPYFFQASLADTLQHMEDPAHWVQ